MEAYVVIKPGDANISDVARGLLDVAAALGLAPAVVEYQPSSGGFKVPEVVAAHYAWMQEETGDFGPVEPPAGDGGEHEADAIAIGGEDVNGQPATGPGEHEGAGSVTPVTPLAPAAPREAPKSMADAQAAETAGPRRYTEEEKAAAVKAVLDDGRTISAVADELGASAASVSKWVTAAKNEGGAV